MASMQNVVVMRHGDRIDSEEPLWARRAQRPWDPPLTEAGKARAWTTGKRLRAAKLGFPIHRVLVSPFLRCLETAREVVAALCADSDEHELVATEFGRSVPTNASGLKVSIEYGLSEVFSRQAIDSMPKDGNWFPSVTELEGAFPPDLVDHSAQPVYQQLPNWGEPLDDARERYKDIILALADKYPSENLLLVTHGEAIGVAVSSFLEGVEVFNVDFCAYSHLQREVDFRDSKTFTAGDFKMLTDNGKTGVPWTEEEHRMFLLGLKKLGKGDWRGIARNFVVSRTPTQVASHAQKYFIRQSNASRRKRRSSLFDIVSDESVDAAQLFPVNCLQSETQGGDLSPPPAPGIEEECESMGSTNSNDAEGTIPKLEGSQCYPIVLPAYFPTFLPFPFPFLPEYREGTGAEKEMHELVRPTAVHSKAPINVEELVGISKLSLGDTLGETTMPSALSLKLDGGSDRQSAFHSNPSTGTSNVNSSSNPPLHAVY